MPWENKNWPSSGSLLENLRGATNGAVWLFPMVLGHFGGLEPEVGYMQIFRTPCEGCRLEGLGTILQPWVLGDAQGSIVP